jgi:hypothetical protein
MKRKRTRTTSPTSPWSAIADQEAEERRRSGLSSFKLLGDEETRIAFKEWLLGNDETRIPFEEWKAEVLKARTLHEQQLKRESGLRAEAEKNKREAARDREHYLDIARQLCEQNPSLRRATPHRLAQLIWAELKKQGRLSARTGKPVWVRSIERALAKKV